MQPDKSRPTTPLIPPRNDTITHVPERQEHRDAAANIARSQVEEAMSNHDPVGDNGIITESSYDIPQHTEAPKTTEEPNAANPYSQRFTDTKPSTTKENSAEWQKYHSAWQQYYQEYYSRFYVGELYKSQTELMKRADERADAIKAQQGMTKDEAMDDIRSQIRQKISNAGKKVRRSRHFIPITAALVVMGVFVFLQYNALIVAAVKSYSSPGSVEPANVLVNPAENVTVAADKDNRLIIPKLNIDVPVDFNAKPDNDSQMQAMTNGVAYFGIRGANAKPGQVGNFGIAGHSSNQWYDSGAYKFIFVNLSELTKGDSIFINYNKVRYTYTVTKSVVVNPTDVSTLQNNTQKPEVTLITCTPIGTALQRLLVSAEQISPDPNAATKSDSASNANGNGEMPGNSPTVFEKLFGGNS